MGTELIVRDISPCAGTYQAGGEVNPRSHWYRAVTYVRYPRQNSSRVTQSVSAELIPEATSGILFCSWAGQIQPDITELNNAVGVMVRNTESYNTRTMACPLTGDVGV